MLPRELYRADQVRRLDAAVIEHFGISGLTLMERAAAACLRAIQTRWPGVGDLTVVAGSGNNAHELACLEAPAVLGELEWLPGNRRTATVEATSTIEAISISFDELRLREEDGCIATYKFIRNVASIVARRLIALDRKIEELSHGFLLL